MARRPKTPTKWIQSAADERAVSLGYYFDERAAEYFRDFAYTFCRHSQGRWAGKPFELQDWQFNDVNGPLYGWKRPDGRRRYSRGAEIIPKKQGKTNENAARAAFHLSADGEEGAVVGLVAVDREQASLTFDITASMIRMSPELSAVCDVIESRKTIVHPASGSKLIVLSADVASKEGLNLSALFLDELHRWRGDMFNTLMYAGAARRQPLFLAITTAGVYDPTSIGWQQYEYARKVLDGTIEDLHFFAYIRAADPEDDWTSEATWAKANPSLGVTVTVEELREQCQAAQHSVSLENSFRRYRLNQWTQSTERWLSLATFDASAGHPIIESDYIGKKFWAGIDLGSVSDLSVAAYLFQCPHDSTALDVVLRVFLPASALKEGPNATMYQEWQRAALLTVTPGEITDETALVETVLADSRRFGCHSVGIDRLFQAMRVSQDLAAGSLEVFPCGMGHMSLSPLVTEMERLLIGKQLHHGGHPILRSAVDAVEMTLDAAGNRKPSRRDRSKKIDALIGVLLSLDRKLRAPVAPPAPTFQTMFLRLGGGRK